jgi:hypothetical protein
MAVRPVSHQEFHACGPYDAPTTDRLAEENEWFSNGEGDVIGVIAKAPTWTITVFGRDATGRFLAFDATTTLETANEARDALFAQMARVGITPAPTRGLLHGSHVRQRIIADRLLAAGLTPIAVSIRPDDDVPRVVFKQGAEFVTIIGVGDTVDAAATHIMQQARERGLYTAVAAPPG